MKRPTRSFYGLATGFVLSVAGVLIGGQTGTLLLAFAGNLLTVTGVYIAGGKRRNGNGAS